MKTNLVFAVILGAVLLVGVSLGSGPDKPAVSKTSKNAASKKSKHAGPVTARNPADGPLDQILSNMHEAALKTKSLQADIHQVKQHTQIGGKDEYKGDLIYLHEPRSKDKDKDKLRIRYYDERGVADQDLLTDGDSVSLYQPKILHVTKTSKSRQAKESPEFDFLATPYSSIPTLKQRYNISYKGDESGWAMIQLKPRSSGSSIVEFTIWVDRSQWLPVQYRVLETNGDVTTFTLSNLRRNAKELPADAFKQSLAKGTKVIYR